MPSSRPYALSYICQRIIDLQPKTVLDIGIGFGKMGFLAREYTDVWNERYNKFSAYNPAPNQTKIVGIEIHKPYITDLHYLIYDRVFCGDAVELMANSMPFLDCADELGGAFDLVLCCDMLEHLHGHQGRELLKWINRFGCHAIVTTPHPSRYIQQGTVYNNAHEKHLCCWPEESLEPWGLVRNFENAMLLLEMTAQ